MGDKETSVSGSSSLSAASVASPASSEISGLLEKEMANSAAASPAPSSSSLMSEQEQNEPGSTSRQSPFLGYFNRASPSSNILNLPARPEFLNVPFGDSGASSSSSVDGIQPSARNQYRTRRRKNSSDSSSSEESVVTIGESVESFETTSRKNSKNKLNDEVMIPGRGADAPRGRIANIRRESNCSIETEAAHEKLVKATQHISNGFDDIVSLDRDPKKRPPSATSHNQPNVGEPISIVTNSPYNTANLQQYNNPFLPNSCTPSPTRVSESYKQCYSPSTQQIVRANVPFSPSPSPTQSPTRNRLMRGDSPIAAKPGMKRRYTAGANMDDLELKRQYVRQSTSPLVTDRTFPYPPNPVNPVTAPTPPPPPAQEFAQPQLFPLGGVSAFSRRVNAMDSYPGVARRISVDSDDQKSAKDDISEPSSVKTEEPMEQEEEAKPEDKSPVENKIPEEAFAEAMEIALPQDTDDL